MVDGYLKLGGRGLKIKIAKGGISIIAFIILAVLTYGVSWILTCGIIKLITVCFGLSFKWSVATGIWLILILAESVFKPKSNK